MSIDFDAFLFMTELFEHIAVRQATDPDCLLIASCRVASGARATAVGEVLVRVWQTELRYRHHAAHRLRKDHLRVYLSVVALSDDGGSSSPA